MELICIAFIELLLKQFKFVYAYIAVGLGAGVAMFGSSLTTQIFWLPCEPGPLSVSINLFVVKCESDLL